MTEGSTDRPEPPKTLMFIGSGFIYRLKPSKRTPLFYKHLLFSRFFPSVLFPERLKILDSHGLCEEEALNQMTADLR